VYQNIIGQQTIKPLFTPIASDRLDFETNGLFYLAFYLLFLLQIPVEKNGGSRHSLQKEVIQGSSSL